MGDPGNGIAVEPSTSQVQVGDLHLRFGTALALFADALHQPANRNRQESEGDAGDDQRGRRQVEKLRHLVQLFRIDLSAN